MTRVVRSRADVEGHVYERATIWSGTVLPPWGSQAEQAIVGRPTPRVDATSKVTGRAIYTDDVYLPGMLFGRVLRSPHAHARVRRIDVTRACALPGVRAVICHRDVPHLTLPNGQPLFDRTARYYGQAVAAVAADTEELADEALGQISVSYEPLPFAVDPAVSVQNGSPLVQPCGNRPGGHNPRVYERGSVRQGKAEAEVIVERSCRTQVALHQCFEPHCAVCRWDGEDLTIWTSTQGVQAVAEDVADLLGIPRNRVQVISTAIGGGFGSKQFAGEEVLVPALLAGRTGRPVKLALDRRAESVATGHREATTQHVRLGARRDGTLTLIEHNVVAGIGSYGDEAMNAAGPAAELYRCPNVRTEETSVYTNLSPSRPFRGPGFTEGTFALEATMDELARKLKLDPLVLRRRNDADVDQVSRQPYSSKPLDEAYCQGAADFGWEQPKAPPSRPGRRRGRGMASAIWGGGGGPPAYAWTKVNSDGTADVILGSQDIGTGTRTALAQIAAEELGFRLEDVRVDEGRSTGPYAPTSGGSQTVATVGPAVRVAAHDARQTLLEVAAAELKRPLEELDIRESAFCYGVAGEKRALVRGIVGKLRPFSIIGHGDRGPNPWGVTIRTFGAQFAEVEVDVETGDVFLTRYVAVHDCGRLISPLQARSQVAGGVTQGIGYALTEEQVVDPRTGIVLNPNLEDYLIPTIGDVPTVEARFTGVVDQLDNPLGVKGLGEPPIIPCAPAIANAIADAIGVRIADLPITRARILDALQREKPREQTRARV
ncbi:MAG TPA: xanthine dehydrogenase family protein molybdopterin-binding subunit [Chloroflexota bacterium]|nr:xanthine dehydrogenase family protein molybdopterin-binding subunit [Chloroflexota bacterium]